MKSFYTLLFLQLLSFCSYSQSKDWITVSVKDGDTTLVKADYHSKNEDGIKNWFKVTKKTYTHEGKKYKNIYIMMLSVFDCENNRPKSIQIIIYNRSGEVIDSHTFKDYEQEWSDVVPETMGELVLNSICKLHN